MAFSPLIDRLVVALRCLPGVGPRSAQRMAFHLLEREREGGFKLAEALELAMGAIKEEAIKEMVKKKLVEIKDGMIGKK